MEDRSTSNVERQPLEVIELGLKPYGEVLDLQRRIHRSLLEGTGRETLILCEHLPVLTVGTSGKDRSFLASREHLAREGVEVFRVERGGDVTFHGPGQIVAYPILDLSTHRRDVGWYMRSLEECVIRFAADYGVGVTRIPGLTGVWIEGTPNRKIASLGVKLSRWKSFHGIAVNVLDSRPGFSLIHPCGLEDIEMTSIEQELVRIGAPPYSELGWRIAAQRFLRRFIEVFEYPPCPRNVGG